MMGWRARLGFLIPPGNPTVEPEMIAMAPPGVSVHFSRMVAHGATGTLDGQEERNRTQIEHLSESAKLLAMVKPNVVVLAHTATSYTLGRRAEVDLVHVRNCDWRAEALLEPDVPPAVAATFRRCGRNFQQTHDPSVSQQTQRLWEAT